MWNLKYAIHFQEAIVQGDREENNTNMIGELSLEVNNFNQDANISLSAFSIPFETVEKYMGDNVLFYYEEKGLLL